jgi:purine-binding chemotaxis protein CheW
MIIVNVNNLKIGIIIDQVYRVISAIDDQIQPPPQMISGIGAEYVYGVVRVEDSDVLLIILNIKKLFNKQELLMLSGEI